MVPKLLGVLVLVIVVILAINNSSNISNNLINKTTQINGTEEPKTSDFLLSLNCQNLIYNQTTKLFQSKESIGSNESEKLSSILRSLQSMDYSKFGPVTYCQASDGTKLLLHEKFIFGSRVNGSNVDIALLDNDFKFIGSSALIISKSLGYITDGLDFTCNQNLKLTTQHILYLECKDNKDESKVQLHRANLNTSSSELISDSARTPFTKKDVDRVQTGPHDYYCYSESVTKIPDTQLIGFSCNANVTTEQRILMESKIKEKTGIMAIGNLTYCTTEENQILASFGYDFSNSNKNSVYFYLFDSQNNIIGQAEIEENTSCQKPALITKEGFGDTIIYYKCGFRGLDLYKLNMNNRTSTKESAYSCS